jgi:hypothetical protein
MNIHRSIEWVLNPLSKCLSGQNQRLRPRSLCGGLHSTQINVYKLSSASWVQEPHRIEILVKCIYSKLPIIRANEGNKTHEQSKNTDNPKYFVWCIHRTSQIASFFF